MAGINETAYPRFKSIITENDLKNVYSPTFEEILYSNKVTRNQKNRLLFLIMLKSYQRLGYPINIVEVPEAIIKHIINAIGINLEEFELEKYDKSITRLRHLEFIRTFLNIKQYYKEAKHIAIKAAADASKTKDNDADIINIVIDQLVYHRLSYQHLAH